MMEVANSTPVAGTFLELGTLPTLPIQFEIIKFLMENTAERK